MLLLLQEKDKIKDNSCVKSVISEYFGKVISDAKIVAQQSISGNSGNPYYAPQFTDRLVRNCIPLSLLWSSIMLGKPTNKCNIFILLTYCCISYCFRPRKPWTLWYKRTICWIFWFLYQEALSTWSGKTLYDLYFHKAVSVIFIATVVFVVNRRSRNTTGHRALWKNRNKSWSELDLKTENSRTWQLSLCNTTSTAMRLFQNTTMASAKRPSNGRWGHHPACRVMMLVFRNIRMYLRRMQQKNGANGEGYMGKTKQLVFISINLNFLYNSSHLNGWHHMVLMM